MSRHGRTWLGLLATVVACASESTKLPVDSAFPPREVPDLADEPTTDAGDLAEEGDASQSDASVSVDGLDAAGELGDGDVEDPGDAGDRDGGEDASADAASVDGPEIMGRWYSEISGDYPVTSTKFQTFDIVEYDNQANYLYARAPVDFPFGPGHLVKWAWTEPENGKFNVCEVTLDLYNVNLDAAKLEAAGRVVDPSNLETGCDDFHWWPAGPVIEIEGTWQGAEGDVVVRSYAWKTLHGTAVDYLWVEAYDNDTNAAVLHHPDFAQYAPETFDRLVWTEPVGDQVYVCLTDTGLASAEEARASHGPSDATAPELRGCGVLDRPWQKLGNRRPWVPEE